MNIRPLDEVLTAIELKHKYDAIGELIDLYDDIQLGKVSKLDFYRRIRDYVKAEVQDA